MIFLICSDGFNFLIVFLLSLGITPYEEVLRKCLKAVCTLCKLFPLQHFVFHKKFAFDLNWLCLGKGILISFIIYD